MSDSLEINSNNSISIVDNDAIVLATNNAIDIKYSEPEYDVTVNKKEYIITGDTLYIPKRYEDTPQWLRDIIDSITDIALSAKISDINNLTQSLNNLIDELNVAKNTYTMSIISSNDINERINTAVETLNSSMMESDSTIIRLATTRVTPEQAQAISIDALRTSLNDTISGNSLGSIISEIKSTTTTGDYTNAQSIEVLKSTVEGNADATASAIDTINTFAGIDETGAYTYTGLTGYLADPNTGMIGGGQSELQNTITTTGDKVEAKFEYGSNIKIGGQYHNAGFGLKTTMTGGDGTTADPYNSEFWINAEKFKFTNNSVSGQATPFSIDATGLQPKITFNGLVTFNAIDSVYSTKLTTNTNTNNDLFAQRLGYMNYADMVSKATAGQTIISGGYLRTNLIQAGAIKANQINTVGLIAENISANTIDGKTITGSFITGAVITGATIRASYLDLDGEIEVLTDFYLCVNGNTTGVPTQAITEGRYRTYSASDIDAVPSSGYVNLYRIPTLSNITASSGFTSLNNGQTLYATLFSYNTANANSNKKVRKKIPTFNQGSGLMYYVSGFSTTGTSYATANDGGSYSLRLGNTTLFTFSFSSFAGITGGSGGHGVCQTSFTWSSYGGASGAQYSSGRYNQYTYVQETEGYSQTFTVSQTVTAIPVIGDVNIKATIIVTPRIMLIDGGDQSFSEWSFPYSVDHTITCLSSSYELPFDWTNTSDRVYWIKNDAISGGQIKFLNLSINNMV